ncbi:macrophage mannose receptor 1-like [Etheostoma cragini]|uniref:macrophage mannose receptor 1-like n=1 Tax=Etheostoma cragini TaxID=417921 RepID=UPI00155E5239|nr:macrophage mannose receptor 1-like [Etheostoma cragini]
MHVFLSLMLLVESVFSLPPVSAQEVMSDYCGWAGNRDNGPAADDDISARLSSPSRVVGLRVSGVCYSGAAVTILNPPLSDSQHHQHHQKHISPPLPPPSITITIISMPSDSESVDDVTEGFLSGSQGVVYHGDVRPAAPAAGVEPVFTESTRMVYFGVSQDLFRSAARALYHHGPLQLDVPQIGTTVNFFLRMVGLPKGPCEVELDEVPDVTISQGGVLIDVKATAPDACVAISSIAAVSSLLSGQWSSTGGQLCDYRFIKEKKTWKEAQEYCRTNHTDLATVSNQEDLKRLKDHPQYQSGAWIGLQRDWRWSQSGVEFRDSNWYPGQPDNQLNKENCVVIGGEWNDKWNDISCDESFKFICYDGNNQTSGNRFYVIDDSMSWSNALNYCRTHHTDLISGVQQLEDFRKHPQNNERIFWIGLVMDWSWSDGSRFSFTHWDKNKQDPEKTCAMTTSGGFWSDDCDKPRTFFCYNDSVILIKENLTWVEALFYCRDHHGDLVSITNLDQQLRVQERAKMAATPYVWLGLRYTCTLDFWFWVSDETVHYTNWDLSKTTGDDCSMSGAMDRGGGHQWVKKINDKNQFNFICSKKSPPQCN